MTVDVKICGITDADHAHLARAHGARWTGYVFFDPSPRNLTLEKARALAENLQDAGERVGVFVNASDAFITEAVSALKLDWVQLHGSEENEDIIRLKSALGLPVIKAIAVSEAEDLASVNAFPDADMFLFDAKPPQRDDALPGGNAMRFPWAILKGFDAGKPYLLAGGLQDTNIKDAVEVSGAGAIDVSSGVEAARGIKSRDKIKSFLKAAKTLS